MNMNVLVSRRVNKRVAIPEGVWVVWGRGRTEDTSRVTDLGVAGLFIETLKVCPVGTTVGLDFLVEDGAIRATAAVRHVKPGIGFGLQFKSIRSEDQRNFVAMIERILRTASVENH